MLASKPRAIIMPTTDLDHIGKPKIVLDNKAKECISLANKRLRRFLLASNFLPRNCQGRVSTRAGCGSATR
jgi:hypothetical protein